MGMVRFGWYLGGMVGAVVLVLAIALHYPRWWTILASLVGITLVLAGMLPASGAAREVPHERWRCQTRLKSITCALWNYKEEHDSFPPAYITDDDGRPIHSWRVLILPYFSEDKCDELYKQYDFNEPWDGPNNKKLLAVCPEPYMCRDALPARRPGMTATSYLAVVGSNAAWPGRKSTSPHNGKLHRNTATTIMLIEVPAAAGIQWTEPKDLSLDALQATGIRPVEPVVHERAENEHFFYYYDVIGPPRTSVAFADGSASSLPEKDLTAEKLRTLLTIGGCSKEDCDSQKSGKMGKSHLRLKWFNCSACVIWLVSVGLLLCWAVRSRKKGWKRSAENGRVALREMSDE
jgi:hypothetical protein